MGSAAEVLVEGPSKRDAEVVSARARGGQLVHIPGVFAPGTFLDAEIVGAGKHHLVGTIA